MNIVTFTLEVQGADWRKEMRFKDVPLFERQFSDNELMEYLLSVIQVYFPGVKCDYAQDWINQKWGDNWITGPHHFSCQNFTVVVRDIDLGLPF